MCVVNFQLEAPSTMKKGGVLQLGLQLDFWIAMDICNSWYFYNMSVIKQIIAIALDIFKVDMVSSNLCATQMQLDVSILWLV